ncbi:MAG: hypothetical protein WAU90_14640 [Methyloceanibacter sp.]
MPPLTLKILASLLQLHGPDATLTSDHKGIDLLLSDVGAQLRDQTGTPPITGEQFAARPFYKTYLKDDYYYGKGDYAKYVKGKYAKAA